jgi:hypothetical protein
VWDHPSVAEVGGGPLSANHRKAYLLLNGSVVPIWLAMILAPRSRFTRRLVRTTTPLIVGLGVSYDALLASGVAQSGGPIDFNNPDQVRGALSTPNLFLAGWAHYIAFDLFVGRWIWQDALARGRAPMLALLLTSFAGPAGLSLYLVQRRRQG